MKWFPVLLAASVACSLAGGVAPAQAKPMVYFDAFPSFGTAYLVDWQPKKRARVVAQSGASGGRYVDDGTQRIITLDTPLESTIDSDTDGCGPWVYVQQIQQLVVRDLPGETRVVEIGQDVYRGGCSERTSQPVRLGGRRGHGHAADVDGCPPVDVGHRAGRGTGRAQ